MGRVEKDLPQGMASPLLAWYRAGHRELPWRAEPTPYRVWISEIMLQQTRVEAVKPYFARFTEALPDVESLAGVPEERLLKLWEGLGYYSRARNLKRAAREITDRFGGTVPSDPADLLTLPGIGSYTAGAISAFAYNKPEPAVDGNVLRVTARLADDDTNVLDPKMKSAAEQALRQVIPPTDGGDFGQAMIELGATVCVPGRPGCEDCPLAPLCLARQNGRENDLPVRLKKDTRRIESRTVLLLQEDRRVAVRRRTEKGLLSGLYELPNSLGHLTPDEVTAYARALGFEPLRVEPLGPARHVFTHITWEMIGYRVRLAETDSLPPEAAGEGYFFTDQTGVTEAYAFPTAFSYYIRQMPISVERS